jgi:hypothetical protein
MASEFVKITAGGAGAKECLTNGLTVINGGGAIADMTLGKPFPGCRAVIRCGAAAGNIVITAAAGTTLNGTNTIATMNAAEDQITLVYDGPSTWAIESNVSVTVSGP